MAIEIKEIKEIKETGLEHIEELARLFSDHLDEQCKIGPTMARNPYFNVRDFVEAMINPKLNEFLTAWDGASMIGFVRLSIYNGDVLLPLDSQVDRYRVSYLKRVPLSILRRLRNALTALIRRMERRDPIHSMIVPIRRGYVADLYILPDHRRKNTGTMLIKAAFEWFAKMGVTYVDLNVLADNEAGRGFWKSMGFEDRSIVACQNLIKPL